MPFADYLIQPGEMNLSPEAIDRKRKIAQMLQQQGMDSSPVQSWTQGAARIANALLGNYKEWKLDKAEKANMDRGNAVLSGLAGALMGGDTSSATPATPSSAPAGGDYFSTMAAKESGGNPNIKNAQGSGATGLYQFMPGTWRGLMEKYPSLGLTYDGMTDPQQQQVAMRQFTADNAKALQAAGIPVNNATLAIAHQQGAGGAIKLLTNPDAPAVNVVGAKAVTMNGGDPRMTAGQFAQKVAGYYMGGSQGLTDRLSPQAAQNVLSGQPGPVPGARADMGAVAAPDRITPQAMQAVMTNQPGPVPGARTDMAASTMPMTLSPQAAGNVMSGQPGPVPGARLPVAQALADIPAAGAQPAGYQIPGQAPMPAPAAPAAMPAQANRAALMQKVIQAWPYLNESQRQQAQMILQMAPKPMTPLEQLQMQEAGLKVQDLQHQQQNWSTSDAQAQANLDRTRADLGQIGKTGAQNDYNFYVQQERAAGREPKSFDTWELDHKRAGAQSVQMVGESEFSRKTGGNQAEMFSNAFKDGIDAKTDLANIGMLRSQIAQTPGGFVGGLQGLANSYGIKLGPNASSVEVASSLLDKLTPAQRQGMPGAASDRDVAMFKNALPKLSNTPEGNGIILDTMEGLAKYRMAQGEIALKVQTGEMSPADGLREISKLPSPFEGLQKRIQGVGSASAAPTAPAAPTPGTGPNGQPTNMFSPIEQEMRRRGLL